MLNVSKCKCISFSRKKDPIIFDYSLHGTAFQRVNIVNDLGVLLDEKLSFKCHYTTIINKANLMLGFVKCWAREFNDPYVTKALFTTLVRPQLEYASQVWSPYYAIDVNRIESLQRRFIRFALRGLPWEDNFHLPSYEDRLKLLDLPTLSNRRRMCDIVLLTQAYNGQLRSNYIKNKCIVNENSYLLRSRNLFYVNTHRTNYSTHNPIDRMLRAVNEVGGAISLSDTKQIFKKKLYIHFS